jgi:N utilization substance protein B
MKIRRQARIVALQTLFEVSCVGHDAQTVLQERLEENTLPPEGAAFAEALVRGVIAHQEQLDDILQEVAPQWPLAQMAGVDVNILRIALFEIVVDRQTPVKVAINEAVELAKLFGSDASGRFVNGVLGTVVAKVSDQGIKKSGARESGNQEIRESGIGESGN